MWLFLAEITTGTVMSMSIIGGDMKAERRLTTAVVFTAAVAATATIGVKTTALKL
jgi:hypothetical protein